jgi:hypothetical protein
MKTLFSVLKRIRDHIEMEKRIEEQIEEKYKVKLQEQSLGDAVTSSKPTVWLWMRKKKQHKSSSPFVAVQK